MELGGAPGSKIRKVPMHPVVHETVKGWQSHCQKVAYERGEPMYVRDKPVTYVLSYGSKPIDTATFARWIEDCSEAAGIHIKSTRSASRSPPTYMSAAPARTTSSRSWVGRSGQSGSGSTPGSLTNSCSRRSSWPTRTAACSWGRIPVASQAKANGDPTITSQPSRSVPNPIVRHRLGLDAFGVGGLVCLGIRTVFINGGPGWSRTASACSAPVSALRLTVRWCERWVDRRPSPT